MSNRLRGAISSCTRRRTLRLALAASAAIAGASNSLNAQLSRPIPPGSPAAATPAPPAVKPSLGNLVIPQLRLAIARCWVIDAGAARDAATQSVQIEFVIKRNGGLGGVPRIVNRRGEPTPVALAQSAVRAIESCAPYTNLPAEAFDKGTLPVRMTFDTRGL
jgi:hypothetical protein